LTYRNLGELNREHQPK